uniref:Uncharacterized protein n=1 Tax=Arundo donax TaxID=35708 RepID=A0A0A8Y4L9_ARUDO
MTSPTMKVMMRSRVIRSVAALAEAGGMLAS